MSPPSSSSSVAEPPAPVSPADPNRTKVLEMTRGPAVVNDHIDARLDARGLPCPEPVVRTRKMLDTLRPGQRLEVLTDDPASPLDFAALSYRTGHALRETDSEAGYFRFVLEHK